MTRHTVHRTTFALVFAIASLLLTSGIGWAAPGLPAPTGHSSDLAKKGEADEREANSAEGTSEGVVNLNTATEEELMRLPGIGASKARAILELRSRLRKFEKVEDVMKVRGIGRATFRRLRPMLRIDGRTTLAGPARASTGTEEQKPRATKNRRRQRR